MCTKLTQSILSIIAMAEFSLDAHKLQIFYRIAIQLYSRTRSNMHKYSSSLRGYTLDIALSIQKDKTGTNWLLRYPSGQGKTSFGE